MQHTMWSDRLAEADRRLSDLQAELELREAAIQATCGASAPLRTATGHAEQHTTSSFRAGAISRPSPQASPIAHGKRVPPAIATSPQHAAAIIAAAAASEAATASATATRAAVIAQVNADAAVSAASSPRATVSDFALPAFYHCTEDGSIHEKQLQLEAALQRARKLGKVMQNQGTGLKAQVRSAKASLATAEAVAKAKDEMLQSRQQELAKTRVELKKACEQLASVRAMHKALQQEWDMLASKQQQHDAAHQQVASDLAFAKAELATLKAQLSDLTGEALMHRAVHVLDTKPSVSCPSPRSTQAMLSLKHEASSLGAELQALKRLRHEDQSQLASTQTAYEQLRQENVQLQAAAGRSEAALQRSEQVLRSSHKLQDALHTATNSIQLLQGRLAGMEQVVASKDAAVNQLQNENTALRAQLSECLVQVQQFAGLHQQAAASAMHGGSSLSATWSPRAGAWSPQAAATWPSPAAPLVMAAGPALGGLGCVPLPQLHPSNMQGSFPHTVTCMSPTAAMPGAASRPFVPSAVAGAASGMQGAAGMPLPCALPGVSGTTIWSVPAAGVQPGTSGSCSTGAMPHDMLPSAGGCVASVLPGVALPNTVATRAVTTSHASQRYQQAFAELQAAQAAYLAEQQPQQHTGQQPHHQAGQQAVEGSAAQAGAMHASAQQKVQGASAAVQEQELIALSATVRAASQQVKLEARRSQDQANKEAVADKERLAEVSAELASKTTELARHRADLETAAQMMEDARTVHAQLAEQLRHTTGELQRVTALMQPPPPQTQPAPSSWPAQQQQQQQPYQQQYMPQQHQEQQQQASPVYQQQQPQPHQMQHQAQSQADSTQASSGHGHKGVNTAQGGRYLPSMASGSDASQQGVLASPTTVHATGQQRVAWALNTLEGSSAGVPVSGKAHLQGGTRAVGFGSSVLDPGVVDRPSETNTDMSLPSTATAGDAQIPPPNSSAAAALGWLSVPTQTVPVYGHDAAHQTQRGPTQEEGDEDLNALLVYMDDELAAMAGGLADREAVSTSLKARMVAVKQLLNSRLGAGANSAQGGASNASSAAARTGSVQVCNDATSTATAPLTNTPPTAHVPSSVTVLPSNNAPAAVPPSPRQPPLSPSAGAAMQVPRSLAAMRVAIPASGQATPALQSFAYRSPQASHLSRVATRKVERTISSASRNTDAPEPSPRAVPAPYNKSYSMHYQALSKSYDAGPSSPLPSGVGGQQDVKSLLSQAAAAVQAASRTSQSGGRTFQRPTVSVDFSRSSTLGRDSVRGPATSRTLAAGAVGSASSRMLDAYKAVTSWAAANAADATAAASLESFDHALADLRANSSDLG